MLGLILKKTPFNSLSRASSKDRFGYENSSVNIFIAEIEKKLIQQSETKPKEWKRYIDDVFSLWDCDRKEVNRIIKRANYFHPTIKFTAEISENQPNHFSRYHGVQRRKIRKRFHLGSQNSL